MRTTAPSFFIGWDVGAWNCDKNRKTRDAIVILDEQLAIVGEPWHGNLRKAIAGAATTVDWFNALFRNCKSVFPSGHPRVTMAIDTPLGISEDFVALVTRQGFVEPNETSGLNSYHFSPHRTPPV